MKINQRLFDHYGIDTNKDLKLDIKCGRPWDTLLIDKMGSCYACECQSWLPQSIGNLQVKSLSEIIASPMRGHIQQSIDAGDYRYCNEHQCHYIRSSKIKTATSENIKYLRLAIDDSCNLSCPSCRKEMIFHKQGSAFETRKNLADKINDWLHSYEHPIQVHMGSDGDPFASHVYRHFMENTPGQDKIKYSILTNGLMFKEFHTRIPNVMDNLQKLAISIDGAVQETYEKLRLGAKWQKLIEGLDSIKESKKKHNFQLEWHMVVQKDNWREMPAMLDLARKYDVGRVYFNMIRDWQTGLDFSKQKLDRNKQFQRMVTMVGNDPIAWIYGLL